MWVGRERGMVEQMTKQQCCLQGHCAARSAPLTLCPVCGWHLQQRLCQGAWGAPSQRAAGLLASAWKQTKLGSSCLPALAGGVSGKGD